MKPGSTTKKGKGETEKQKQSINYWLPAVSFRGCFLSGKFLSNCFSIPSSGKKQRSPAATPEELRRKYPNVPMKNSGTGIEANFLNWNDHFKSWHSFTSWWFQPLWKILVKNRNLPQIAVKINNIWNHHLVRFQGDTGYITNPPCSWHQSPCTLGMTWSLQCQSLRHHIFLRCLLGKDFVEEIRWVRICILYLNTLRCFFLGDKNTIW